jgi:AraC-like DNA-binding protein
MAQWLRGSILPGEEILHRSDVVVVGRLRLVPESPFFENSGPIDNHVFVFPRQSVVIQHESHRPFVADANVIPLYNAGQHYLRRMVEPRGDCSDWFAVAPDVLLDAARRWFPAIESRPERPFPVPFVPSPAHLFRLQRTVLDALTTGVPDGLLVEEAAIDLLERVLQLATNRRAAPITPSRRNGDHVEQVKATLAVTLDQPCTLRSLASGIGVSVYHLCRLFRRETGFTIHEYRQELRLRRALDEVLLSHDLLGTALALGFNSHSHFTFAFRKAFGITPSELRRQRALRHPLPALRRASA